MKLMKRRLLMVAGTSALLLAALLPGSAGAARPGSGAEQAAARRSTQRYEALHRMGRGNLRDKALAGPSGPSAADPATADPASELPPVKRPNAEPDTRVTPAQAPDAATSRVTGRAPGALAFESLTAADSRYAFGGNQFTNEPPDQALCVGNGFTLASVNTAIAVYDYAGGQLVPTVAINEFFGLAPAFNREAGTFGPFAFDPVCLYEPGIERWFYVVTELDQDPFSGALTGGSNLYIAVSATSDPLGDWAFYSINTTLGDSTDVGCPCFDDFPHIGADRNGFYISANRFSIFDAPFNGAQIHAVSKQLLAANAADPSAPLPTMVSIDTGRIDGDPAFTVQPMTVPPDGDYPGNRQFFLSTTDFDTVREDKIGIWALSNTDSLALPEPDLRLSRRTIPSLRYVLDPNVEQRPGRRPLGRSVGEELNSLNSGSDMSEVKYAAGRLWGAIGTAIGSGADQRDGVLWVQVDPFFTDGRVDGEIVGQGYVATDTNSLFYPAIGVNADGEGAMVMSYAGPTVFPSSAYVHIDLTGVRGPVRVTALGTGPSDGFTCYEAFVGSRDRGCRWGDYSAATADEKGRIWMATEWISDSSRIPFANWSTEIIRYSP